MKKNAVTLPLVLVCCLLLLAGCSVGPDYQRPDSETPAGWQGAGGQTGEWPGGGWWRTWRAPDLEGLMQQARTANFDLAAAVARLRQANAQIRIAGGAQLPAVDLAASGERLRQAPSYKTGTTLLNAGLTASYQLDLWGAVADQVAAARLSATASRYDLASAELTVQSAVADGYFAVLSLNDRISLAEDNIRAAEGVLEAYQARLAVGAASELDVAQQANVVEEQRALLPPLLEQRRQTADALAVLAGRLPHQLAPPPGSLSQVLVPPLGAGLPSGLLSRRPDVQSAEARLRAANQNIKAATAALFPSITLTAAGGGASETLANLFKPQGVFYALDGALSQPLFRGGALQGGIDLTAGLYDEQLAVYRKAVVSAFAEVEDALVAVEMEARRETADQAASDTARHAYDIAQAQLFNGTIDSLIVLNTQRTLFQADDQLAQARLAHVQAMVSLFIALGGGWQVAEES